MTSPGPSDDGRAKQVLARHASPRVLRLVAEIRELDRQAEWREARRIVLQAKLDRYTCKKLGGHPVGEGIPDIVRRQYDGGPIAYDRPGGGW